MSITALCISKDNLNLVLMDSTLATKIVSRKNVTSALNNKSINIVNAVKKGTGYAFVDISDTSTYNICRNWAKYLAEHACKKFTDYMFLEEIDNASDNRAFVISNSKHIIEISHNMVIIYDAPNYTNMRIKRIEEANNTSYKCFSYLDIATVDSILIELKNTKTASEFSSMAEFFK